MPEISPLPGYTGRPGNLIFIAVGGAQADTLNEANAGELLLREEGSGHYHPALQLESKVDIQVSGMVAEVALEQLFRNNSDRWVEAVYVFPLPDDAAVNYLQMQIGERVIIGEIKEKQAARNIYRQARLAGKKAALVERQRPNMFTNRVANIGPGESVRVSLRYVQQVAYRDGEFSLRFPMTITPRYITDQVADASQITPLQTAQGGPLLSIQASIDMGLPLAIALISWNSIPQRGRCFHALCQPALTTWPGPVSLCAICALVVAPR